MASRRAVGSLIGIGFLLMILAVGVSYYNLRTGVERQSNVIIQDMAEFDQGSADETLSIQYVELTPGNSLNLTIKNTGNIISQLEWIGVFDITLNKEAYYRVDTSLNPLETEKDIGNTSIVMNPLNTYTIQVLTRLGNIYYGEYPMPVTPVTGGGGAGNTTYYYVQDQVDNYTPIARGTHSLFNAMKAGPDHINNTITEELVTIDNVNITLIDDESFEGTWPPPGWLENSAWNREASEKYWGTFSADFDGGGGGNSGTLDSPALDTSDATVVYVDFWFNEDKVDPNEFLLEYWDGTSWDIIEDLGNYGTENIWHNYVDKIIDSQYFVADFRVRFTALGVGASEHMYVDNVTVIKTAPGNSYYDLDLEAEWTLLPSKTNEYLSIYGGEMGAEALRVDYWNGATWVNLITTVEPGYNIVDVSGVLTGSTFTIRFDDTTEEGDIIQDSWVIDSVYLHLFD
ncbi:MAG: hypothetical protein NWF07_05255 [Candidatus Bathyarchaeota archaeon]|nr:hypothetical protein [Candidatus Bathyarchaeota archaeon]